MTIFDTSAFVEMLRNTDKGQIIGEAVSSEDIAITPFTVFELLMWPHERDYLLTVIKRTHVLATTTEDGIQVADIKSQLAKRGVQIASIDLFIAAAARAEGFGLVTCDKIFEKIPGLDVRVF